MLRVGIAGLGFMGMTHYHAIQRLRGVRVDAICTRDSKKRAGEWAGIRGNFGPRGGREDLRKVRAYAALEDLLADPELDLIDITLPTRRHLDVTLAALRAGRHVLVEKPIAVDPRAGRRMTNAARAANRRLLVAHVLPFFPEFQAAFRIVRSGRHGKLLGAHFKRIISKPDWSREALDAKKGGGLAIDLHIHDTHFIQALTGAPRAVFSRGLEQGGTVPYLVTQYLYDDPNLTVSCASGGIAGAARSFTHGFEIYMQKGSLVFEWSTLEGKAVCPQPLTLLLPNGRAKRVPVRGAGPLDAFAAEIKYAAETLKGKHGGALLDGEGALAALRLCHCEIRSVRRGALVRV